MRVLNRIVKLFIVTVLAVSNHTLNAATMISNEDSFMSAGTFYGPGSVDDTPLFGVVIRNIAFPSSLNFITPFINNGSAKPNICGESEVREQPTGLLSDGVTRINENVDVCSFEINGMNILVAIIDGGPHEGEQLAVTMENGQIVMTMDTALDLGVGESGIIRLPFYGTTGEATVPFSLQTQLGIEGGIDRAGSIPSGTVLKGRLGDYNNDGVLDGAIVVAGNIPIDSLLLPGAPYAFIRYFETDLKFDGEHLLEQIQVGSNTVSENSANSTFPISHVFVNKP